MTTVNEQEVANDLLLVISHTSILLFYALFDFANLKKAFND